MGEFAREGPGRCSGAGGTLQVPQFEKGDAQWDESSSLTITTRFDAGWHEG